MFIQVSNAEKFNSYINNKKFDLAYRFLKDNDVQFSYIDSQSVSCFDSIKKATFQHFTVHGPKLNDNEISILDKILCYLLEKEPYYWYKQVNNMQTDVYYFFNFFLQNDNTQKIRYFTENIKKFTNVELEEKYICFRKVSAEMGELIRTSSENTKITVREIELAYIDCVDNSHINSTQAFIDFLDNLTTHKKNRKLTYNHNELVNFCLNLTENTDFIKIFPKVVELFTPELFKKYKPSESIDEQFPMLSTRLDFLAARIFSCMNFTRTHDGIKQSPIDKNLTLPLLSYLQTINFKNNINDYVIGEFRYKFVPISLEFLIPSNSKDWPSELGMTKEEGFSISSQYFSNFFVHLLADSLVSNSTFTTEENKIARLTEYKRLYPLEFKKDLRTFEDGLKALGLKQALNADINNIRLYFKMQIAEEENNKVSVKAKTNKI